jgi:hypothetical protein
MLASCSVRRHPADDWLQMKTLMLAGYETTAGQPFAAYYVLPFQRR